jgi:transcriptional regulator with XRE-family HTH domain
MLAPMVDTLEVLLKDSDPDRVRRALVGFAPELIEELDLELAAALAGSWESTREYVLLWRRLAERLLDGAQTVCPNGRVELMLVEDASTQAPFGGFTSEYGLGEGAALELTSHIRELLGLSGLTGHTPAEPETFDDLAVRRFLTRARVTLNQLDGHELSRLMSSFQLSKTDLAELFGVRRQAIDGWLKKGVPAERQEKLQALAALADLLERKLKPGRVPGVARTPADAYGGLTMLEMIERDRHRELLALVRRSFDWSTAA